MARVSLSEKRLADTAAVLRHHRGAVRRLALAVDRVDELLPTPVETPYTGTLLAQGHALNLGAGPIRSGARQAGRPTVSPASVKSHVQKGVRDTTRPSSFHGPPTSLLR